MSLDKAWMSKPRFERTEDRIEPLHVTNLQNQFSLRCQFRQLAGLRRIFRDRFLDQQMFALFEESASNRVMRIGRSSKRSGVDQPGEFFQGLGRVNLVLPSNFGGGLGI